MPDITYPKISIVTPSYNLGKYLEQTILSVIHQSYPNLEYIIIDGGSTDDSVEIIKKYEQHLAYWVSEPDKGLYHALQKGFEKSTGEIMAWLNADDMYHPGALMRIKTVFRQFPQVRWLIGFPSIYDESGQVVIMPPGTFKKWSKYDIYTGHYQWIQQESTFWRRDLWQEAGGKITDQYKLAGDFELWLRFFRYALLYAVPTLVGGYRVRKEQLSRSKVVEYEQEIWAMIRAEHLDKATKSKVKKIKLIRRMLAMNKFFNICALNLYYYRLFEYPDSILFNDNRQQLEMDKKIDPVDFKLKMPL